MGRTGATARAARAAIPVKEEQAIQTERGIYRDLIAEMISRINDTLADGEEELEVEDLQDIAGYMFNQVSDFILGSDFLDDIDRLGMGRAEREVVSASDAIERAMTNPNIQYNDLEALRDRLQKALQAFEVA